MKVHVPFRSPELKNSKIVSDALLECIRIGDLDAFRDVLISYMQTANKVELAKKSGIGRRTLYDLINTDKEFNPELNTVAALIRALAA